MKGTKMKGSKLLLMLLVIVYIAVFASIVSANTKLFTKKEIIEVKEQIAKEVSGGIS